MTPQSTYRLQLNRDFDFADATELIPYLRDLGVDWLYLSPIFAASRGSTHGYDVTDPTAVNPELGGRAGLETLCGRAHAEGLRVLIDIVPNHEAASPENRRWSAALASRTAGWFDVDWPAGEPRHRRFFDVDGLVGVRVEDEAVFRASHVLVFELLDARLVDGLRVDHVDGLADPARYLEWLRAAAGDAFIVVEKILSRDESLPHWPVAGTTGYEAGGALTELCIDPDGRDRLVAALDAVNGAVAFAAVERTSKDQVLDGMFRPEWDRLLGLVDDDDLAAGLRELTLALDVYRVYDHTADDRDRFERAAVGLDRPTAAALRARLLDGPGSEPATRWRQLTGSVMAKGREDTAFYRYPALLAQNEVGGDPAADGRDAQARFDQLAGSYAGLVGTSTHDSKRSEDVRARLCVLSERAEEFEAGFAQWCALVVPPAEVLPTDLRFLAQTLLGAWPLSAAELPAFGARIAQYLTKALREAKQRTNWIRPDVDYEQKVIDCALRTLADDGQLLHDAFGKLVDDVCFFGALNALAMLTWKLAMPGTPDVYRGCELWDLSLVDPDNRRPVDFGTRREMLAGLREADPADLLRNWRSGALKMHVTATGLRARRDHPDLFRHGRYVPLRTPAGTFGFARNLGDAWAVAIAPRWATRVTTTGRWPIGPEFWGDSVVALPDGPRTEIKVASVLGTLPAAILVLD